RLCLLGVGLATGLGGLDGLQHGDLGDLVVVTVLGDAVGVLPGGVGGGVGDGDQVTLAEVLVDAVATVLRDEGLDRDGDRATGTVAVLEVVVGEDTHLDSAGAVGVGEQGRVSCETTGDDAEVGGVG